MVLNYIEMSDISLEEILRQDNSYCVNVTEIVGYTLGLYIVHFGIYWIEIAVLTIGGG